MTRGYGRVQYLWIYGHIPSYSPWPRFDDRRCVWCFTQWTPRRFLLSPMESMVFNHHSKNIPTKKVATLILQQYLSMVDHIRNPQLAQPWPKRFSLLDDDKHMQRQPWAVFDVSYLGPFSFARKKNTPLKNMSESQLGWWNSQYDGQIKSMFQTTNKNMQTTMINEIGACFHC